MKNLFCNESGALHVIALFSFILLIVAALLLVNGYHDLNELQERVKELNHRVEMLDSRVTTSELKLKTVELKAGL